jgi:glycine/D-amino acid oxidase-like deaminating enzyme
VVAGAGIVGASVAYHLARSGVTVTIIDQQGPATHASRGSFAWINATWAKQPHYYHSLSQASVVYWHELQQALRIPVRWGGSLEWFPNATRQVKLAAQITEQADWGERARMVDSETLALLEPKVDFGGARQAAFSENDGAVDPVLATQMLLQAARQMGATTKYPCELTGVSFRKGKLVSVNTSLGNLAADKLVLATGAAPDMAKRLTGVHIPQRSRPGIIVTTAPFSRIINRVIVAPGIHMHQRDDGRIVLGEQDGAPQNDAHAMRLSARPNDFPNAAIASEHAARMRSTAKRFIPAISGAEIESVFIGWRPLPLDGHPVLGAPSDHPDVYLTLMHSGITLAPIVGQLAAKELISGEPVTQLERFRPDRIFELIKRY